MTRIVVMTAESTARAVCLSSLLLDACTSLARAENSYSFEWIRQFGTGSCDNVAVVSTDSAGGMIGGSLDGPSAGLEDAFIRRYYADDTHLGPYPISYIRLGVCGENRDGTGVPGISRIRERPRQGSNL